MRVSERRPDLSIRCHVPPREAHLTDPIGIIHPSPLPRDIRSNLNLFRKKAMTDRLHYGTPAKVFHWVVVALLLIQYPLGWFMPDVHGGPPGNAMTFHVSFGITILILMGLRFGWRIIHPVAPESSLPNWQRVTSEALHCLLYVLVLATTMTGWFFASFRGWSVSYFNLARLPMLASKNADAIHLMDSWHQFAEWALLIAIGIHVAAALMHIFVYRDHIMQRMLPDRR
jgi:cytochrome b561